MNDQDELKDLLEDFRDTAKKELGYVEEGAWYNNRIKGLAFKSGYSYNELWIQVYRINDGPRTPISEPVHFHGHFGVADMIAVLVAVEGGVDRRGY